MINQITNGFTVTVDCDIDDHDLIQDITQWSIQCDATNTFFSNVSFLDIVIITVPTWELAIEAELRFA